MASTRPPLKIIIMTGQSNMQGHGPSDHLDALTQGTWDTPSLDDLAETTAYLKERLQDGSGNWNQRDDVYITYHSASDLTGTFDYVQQGQLMSVGYGKTKARFGPEVGFGWKLGNLLTDDEEVFIIKVAWGGASLAQDFRPPSRRNDINPNFSEPAEGFGWAYNAVVTHVTDTLAAIGSIVPNYDPVAGHELVGLVFFQGFNDVINSTMVNEYEINLSRFVSDMRNDLGTSDLKVVIGELGMHGPLDTNCPTQTAGVSTLRKAQRTVADNDVGVRFAETGIYSYGHISDQCDPEYKEPWGTQSHSLHYYNNADTMYYMGESMGNAMYEMLTIR
jgi:hypothetical protein